MASRYDENTKVRAVRLVREHAGDYQTEWAALKAISARLGMSAETLRKWVRQAEVDAGEAVRHAAAFRARQGHPFDDAIHHSDAGSQYTAIHFTETLMLAGLKPSVGSVGDALDNALCETTIGLYKTECIRDGSPFRTGPIRTLADLEDITTAWVHWLTSAGSCTASTGDRPPKPTPITTLTSSSDSSTPITHSEVWFKPRTLHQPSRPRARC
jgi:hypothetical protein